MDIKSEVNIEILYQDDNFIAVNKPSGVIVHPWSECADKVSLMGLVKEITGRWVYPVHRLDRPVSGVIVFAFSSEFAKTLKESLESQQTEKIYFGLCKGVVKEPRIIHYPLKNQSKTKKQEASTAFWPIISNEFSSFVKFRILTGRYHQIRRHCSAMSHQLIGDTKYGKGKINRYYREHFELNRLFLHCSGLRLLLPGYDLLAFSAPLPDELKLVLERLSFSLPVESSYFDSSVEDLKEYSKKDLLYT